MGQLIHNVQIHFKKSSTGILVFLFRLFSGMVLGLTFALAGEEAFAFEGLMFWFILVSIAGIFMRVSKGWGFGGVAIFDLVCVLLGTLLRMYILVAPGA